jgi:photosynthetic reaction center cytochrome c subunit
MKLGIPILLVLGLFVVVAMMFTSGWERPPIKSEQVGYRGVGTVSLINPRTDAARRVSQQAPDEPYPLELTEGESAGEFYENVQVLGDLGIDQFNRLMAAITEWVSPEQGCAYCHADGEEMSSDSLYTKVVSRRMLQLTLHINTNWKDHVGDTGVTCYTCHRGNPVPANIWFEDASAMASMGMLQAPSLQNKPNPETASSSLPVDYLGDISSETAQIRVIGQTPLPIRGETGRSIQATERTYGLMMHMSQSLGVNCTYCHNSRVFSDWSESSPQRVTAWHGLAMARDINLNYLIPLQPVYPANRLGALGDAPKANCATCHYGVNKPLYGAQMLSQFPSLAGPQ